VVSAIEALQKEPLNVGCLQDYHQKHLSVQVN
ncbi:MAG: hypothetical protein FD167_4239, partial [bacterium]